MKCERLGCGNEAAFRPSVEIWPDGHPEYGGPPATADIGLRVCPDHATEAAAVELLEHSFDYLRRVCRGLGRADPDPERTSIRWLPIQ